MRRWIKLDLATGLAIEFFAKRATRMEPWEVAPSGSREVTRWGPRS